MGRNSGGTRSGASNSVEGVLSHKFGQVPPSSSTAFLEFGKKNISKTSNANAREYGGLPKAEYYAKLEKLKSLKKAEDLSPQDVIDSIAITKRVIEHTQYELKVAGNAVVRHSISATIVQLAESVHSLNEWFDTSINNPKFYNKQWRDYYKKHKDKFK